MVEGKTTTYTANYSNHTSSTVYNWTSSTGNLSVISGNGTNTITVRGAAAGSSTLKVTAGSSASATKLVEVTSSTTIISNEIIRTNKSFSNKNLQIYNVEVLDNAVVNFIAEELVHITPGFYAKEGTTVTIKATGSALRSSFASEAPQLLEVASEEYSLVSLVDNPVEAKIVSLKVYSLTGMLLYSSDTDFELSLLDLSDGIYIVERSYDNGEIKRKKSYLKKQ